ncbi:nucleoside diphosphate-linked moiety X motif 8 [Anoplophora glabripennis]|uniref:nucleoside diphosphate-linked moiety X motif 8 n=1 Tax=Anoplophora glabripennis TaxID=217634 RepID=UPI00087598B0|nr:nucleoside diphosphate-linked moiety X motif 8 [Anoplophora glabripennis]
MFFISRVIIQKSLGQRCSSLYSAENIFSEENIKRTIAKFATMKPIRLHTRQPPKKAAVLIPLCEVGNKVSLLYTLRAAHLKSHRGQVSFPGGMQDVTDKSLEETALRETEEELGIGIENIEIWGSGHFIVTRGETSVLPVIGRIKKKLVLENLKINTHEVEEVFTVPLEELCDPSKIGHTQFRGSYSVPVFLGGKRRIWGLTAMITNICLSSLLSHKAYTHKITYIPPIKSHNVVTY